jgi:tetratricopeptide (TPR) repeat protein
MYESIYQMIASGNTQTAKSLLDRILETDPFDFNALALSGMAWWHDGDPKKGEFLFNQSLALNPNEPSILLIYAHCLMKSFRVDEAITILEKAFGIDPNFSNIAEQLVIANYNKGLLSKALEWAKIAATADPTGRNLASLGFIFSLNGFLEEGESAIFDALNLDPDNAIVHFYSGMFWLFQGNSALARRHLEIAVSISPEAIEFRTPFGLVFSENPIAESVRQWQFRFDPIIDGLIKSSVIGTILFAILDMLFEEGYKLVVISTLAAVSFFSIKVLLKSSSAIFLLSNRIGRDLLIRTKVFFNRDLYFETLSAIGLSIMLWIRLFV